MFQQGLEPAARALLAMVRERFLSTADQSKNCYASSPIRRSPPKSAPASRPPSVPT
jgi:hypothetical protein